MLQDRRTDLLLTISRHVLRIVIAILGLIIAAALGAMIALLFFPSRSMTAQLAAAPDITMPVIFASVAIGILMLVLSVRFMIELGRIVRTVQQGDPFDPENADRLARMGWLALAVTIARWGLVPLVSWLAQYLDGIYVREVPEFGGLALAVTLFILARVFRHGAAMRDDLEGTV
jgi:hypothetical protein